MKKALIILAVVVAGLLTWFGVLVFTPLGSSGEIQKASSFDKKKWMRKEGGAYSYRPHLVDVLLYTDTVRGKPLHEVIELLGMPDRTKENYLYYLISEKKAGNFTLHTRTLVMEVSGDSTVNWVKIHE